MKFKTTIQITTEAENKNEAMEIVGEYLCGNLMSGVDMKCLTKPVRNYKRGIVLGSLVVFFIVGLGILTTISYKHPQSMIQGIYGVGAIQPPLKTSISADKENLEFKHKWEDRQAKEALEYIKK